MVTLKRTIRLAMAMGSLKHLFKRYLMNNVAKAENHGTAAPKTSLRITIGLAMSIDVRLCNLR